MLIKRDEDPGMVVHTFNPSTPEADTGKSLFEASLLYIVSLKPARALS